jgi:hypothetical protein
MLLNETLRSYWIKYTRLFALVGLLIVLTGVSLGCASTTKPMGTEADLIGFITEIHPNGERGILGRISVESHADKIVSKYIITIKAETPIFRQDGNDLRKVPFHSLENKQWVEIWFTGPIVGSFPVQGTAGQIVIVE